MSSPRLARSPRLGSKGSIFDVVVLSMVLGIMAITIFLGYDFLNQLDSAFDDAGLSTQVTSTAVSNWVVWDSIFVLAFVLFLAGSVATAFMVQTHPVYFVFFVIMLGLTLLVAGLSYEMFSSTMDIDTLGQYQATFPYINLVMSNYVLFIMAMGFIVGLALFVRMSG